MDEIRLSRGTLWRLGLAALLMLGLVLAIRAPALAASCNLPRQFDPARGLCVDPEEIDCGPNPYVFNAVGGHWERLFYEVCWHANGDAFEKIYHGLNYAEVQGRLAEQGLAGLSHDEQVAALLAAGALGGPGGTAPYCPPGYELNAAGTKCEPDVAPDCGPNPYAFNGFSGEWERDFNKWCFEINRDPFEILFHKRDFDRAQSQLASVGLGGLTHDEALAGLEALGYWNVAGAYVPDGAPTFPR